MKTFKEFINETTSGDIATASSILGGMEKRIQLNQPEDLDIMFKNGKYVAMKVKNNEELYLHFQNQGLTPVDMNELHTTIAYSKDNFPHTINEGEIIIEPKNITGFDLFGDDENILVMTLKSEDLQRRFDETQQNGAHHGYPLYIPHITLSYDYNIEKHGPPKVMFTTPKFPIILHNEYVEPLTTE